MTVNVHHWHTTSSPSSTPCCSSSQSSTSSGGTNTTSTSHSSDLATGSLPSTYNVGKQGQPQQHHKGKTWLLFLWCWLRARIRCNALLSPATAPSHRSRIRRPSFWLQILGVIGLIAASVHRCASITLRHKEHFFVEAPIHHIERECPAMSYETLGQVQRQTNDASTLQRQQPTTEDATNINTKASLRGSSERSSNTPKDPLNPKICVTTLTDQQQADWTQKWLKWRQFDNLLEITWPNKQDWCDKHGYFLYDMSHVLDNTRPPSWSKILAAQTLLNDEQCDWVLWLDADTVVMNSEKRIEDFLPSPDSTQDFVVTRQKTISYNAGAWAIRNTPWAHQFLQDWWDMDSYVRSKGLAVSGDNDALYNFLTRDMTKEYFNEHIAVPPRCHFNSVTKWVTPSEAEELEKNEQEMLKKESYYMHPEYYHRGDLIAHIAGRDNKVDTTLQMLDSAT